MSNWSRKSCPAKTSGITTSCCAPNFLRSEGYDAVFRGLGYSHAIFVIHQETIDSFLPSKDNLGVILLDPDGRLVAIDESARAIFSRLAAFDGFPCDAFTCSPIGDALEYIRRIIRTIFAPGSDTTGLRAPVVRFHAHWTGTIVKLRGVLPHGADGREYINILVERGESVQDQLRTLGLRFGLTDRETQILDWIARGKTNSEVGTILEISALTVKKHLEKIYLAMGVETRTAAAAMALGAAGGNRRSIELTRACQVGMRIGRHRRFISLRTIGRPSERGIVSLSTTPSACGCFSTPSVVAFA